MYNRTKQNRYRLQHSRMLLLWSACLFAVEEKSCNTRGYIRRSTGRQLVTSHLTVEVAFDVQVSGLPVHKTLSRKLQSQLRGKLFCSQGVRTTE